jgi:hypothetical protein
MKEIDAMTEISSPQSVLTPETSEMGLPIVHFDAFHVPHAFLQNCGTWEGTAKRVENLAY